MTITPAALTRTPDVSAALGSLRLQRSSYIDGGLAAPYRLHRAPQASTLTLYVVTEGDCWLVAEAEKPAHLERHHLALVAGDHSHDIVSEPGTTTPAATLATRALTPNFATGRAGAGDPTTRVVIGALDVAPGPGRMVLSHLPPVLHIFPKDTLSEGWIPQTIRMIAREAADSLAASEEVMTRLADALVLLAVRAWVEDPWTERTGMAAALADSRIGAAMTAVQADPARDWDVAAMAATAGMSRSAFSARFGELTSTTPMRYVATWRLEHAAHLLATTDLTVAAVAARTGYASESAFSRAFARHHGVSPAASRAPRTTGVPHDE